MSTGIYIYIYIGVPEKIKKTTSRGRRNYGAEEDTMAHTLCLSYQDYIQSEIITGDTSTERSLQVTS